MAAVHINSERFAQMMRSDRPVLVDFWAPWCVYCRRIGDAYDSIAEQYGDQIEVVKVNIDDEEALALQEEIEVIPTLVLYQNGRAVNSIVAPESKAAIEAFISESIQVQNSREEEKRIEDMVVIGGGPGGYTAALYAARAGLGVTVIEKLSAGGQMALTHQIDNYPGFEDGIDGFELAQRMQKQAERFGAKSMYAKVLRLHLQAQPKVIERIRGQFTPGLWCLQRAPIQERWALKERRI